MSDRRSGVVVREADTESRDGNVAMVAALLSYPAIVEWFAALIIENHFLRRHNESNQ